MQQYTVLHKILLLRIKLSFNLRQYKFGTNNILFLEAVRGERYNRLLLDQLFSVAYCF